MRFRPLMIPAIVEQLSFGIAVIVLFALGRIHGALLPFGPIDLRITVLFAVSRSRTPAT